VVGWFVQGFQRKQIGKMNGEHSEAYLRFRKRYSLTYPFSNHPIAFLLCGRHWAILRI
jgi:hypothetical protein